MNKPEKIARLLEIVQIGDAVGVILPRDVLERLQVEVGDKLSLRETENGVALANEDSDFAKAMRLADEIMDEDREILRVLAK